MQVTRNSLDTATGPSDWFTGTVYINTIATPSEPSRLAAASVHFAPGARTAWHTHPYGQTISDSHPRVRDLTATTSSPSVEKSPGSDRW
jgi:hypothetical protein